MAKNKAVRETVRRVQAQASLRILPSKFDISVSSEKKERCHFQKKTDNISYARYNKLICKTHVTQICKNCI
jgi:hypothetical protein